MKNNERLKANFKYSLEKLKKFSILFNKKLNKSHRYIKEEIKSLPSNPKVLELKAYSIKKVKKFIRWLNNDFSPKAEKFAGKIVTFITYENGSENWNSLKPTNKWSRITIWTLVYFAGFGILWSSISRVDETVQTTGKLEPRGTTIDVKVPLGGVIEKILVKEGEIVEKQQILLKLDTTAVMSKLKALEVVKSQVEADILLSKIQLGNEVSPIQLNQNQQVRLESLNKEYSSRIESSKNAIKQAEFAKRSAEENVKSTEKVLLVREKILNNLKPLKDIGGISEVKFLKEEVEVIQLRGRLEAAKNELNKVNENLLESKNRLDNTIAASKIDFSTKIEENTKQLAQLENQINESKLTLSYQEIKSPVDGYVFDLQPAAPGYVVNSDSPILKVVPTDDLVARVFISNRDIAFIKKDQKVKIRVDAYPYNEFGEISGKIDSIGSDVLEPDAKYDFFRFPVTVKLDKPFILNKKRKLPLISGMSLSANIVLRKRPVISIFTKQILPFWDKLEQL